MDEDDEDGRGHSSSETAGGGLSFLVKDTILL